MIGANNGDFQEVGAVLTHWLAAQTIASWLEEDTGLVAGVLKSWINGSADHGQQRMWKRAGIAQG